MDERKREEAIVARIANIRRRVEREISEVRRDFGDTYPPDSPALEREIDGIALAAAHLRMLADGGNRRGLSVYEKVRRALGYNYTRGVK